jgi:hypothetical protein
MKAEAISLLAGKEPIRKTVLFQLQYDQGELYFDRSGALVRKWQKLYVQTIRMMNFEHEWVCEFGPRFAVFSLQAESSPFQLKLEQVEQFAAGVYSLVSELVDEFKLSHFQQLNYKETYHFLCESIEESSQWIRRIGIAPIPEGLLKTFGPEYYAQTTAIVMFSSDCRYRIEVKGMESPAMIGVGQQDVHFRPSTEKRLNKKELIEKLKQDRVRKLNPDYYACIELEAFLWEPIASDFEIKDFIERHSAQLLKKLRECVATTEQKNV